MSLLTEVQALRGQVADLTRAVRREQARANGATKAADKAEQRALTHRATVENIRYAIGEFLRAYDADGTEVVPGWHAELAVLRAYAGTPRLTPEYIRGVGKPPALQTSDQCWEHLQRIRRLVRKGLPETEFWVEAEAIVQIAQTLVGEA